MRTNAFLLGAVAAGAMLADVAAPAPATANFWTAGDLYERCTATPGTATYYQRDAICTGFIVGAIDAIQTFQGLNNLSSCLGSNVTIGQMKDVVVRWLRDNPSKRGYDASAAVVIAMQVNFQCRVPVAPSTSGK